MCSESGFFGHVARRDPIISGNISRSRVSNRSPTTIFSREGPTGEREYQVGRGVLSKIFKSRIPTLKYLFRLSL